MKRLLLVRHGETAWNREGRIQGWAHTSLTAVGRRQAQAVATHLADIAPDVDVIVASDLPRAAETAAIIQREAYPDSPLTEDAGWRERDFGVFQGYASESFFTDYPEYAIIDNGRSAAANTPEKGESYLEFRDRIHDQWATLTEESTADDLVLVVHGGVIRVIVAIIEDLGLAERIQSVNPGNGSVTTVAYDCGSGDATIRTRDHRKHLTTHV